VQQEADKQKKKDEREKEEEKQRQAQAREMVITEYWKPYQTTIRFFEEAQKE
jgi:hypothetical protein